MAYGIDTNKRHYPKEIIDKTIMEMSWDKLADFTIDYNGNDTTDALNCLYENHKRGFPSFTSSLFEEQKLRNEILKKNEMML